VRIGTSPKRTKFVTFVLSVPVQPSAWKGNSANLALRGFSEVRGLRGPSAVLQMRLAPRGLTMRCMGTHGPVLRGSRGISRDALTVKRHRNPLGIFSRALVYPLIGLGAWRHRLDLVASGLVLEALLWTAVPPVEETFGFIEDAIETELDWLNAPQGPGKTLSFAVLALFPVALFVGLWRRSWRLLAAAAGLITLFYLLMRRVARGPTP